MASGHGADHFDVARLAAHTQSALIMIEGMDFHFLRPAWLLALLPLAWLFTQQIRQRVNHAAWKKIVDPVLLPHLLSAQATPHSPLRWLLATGWLLAVIALSGPTWTQAPAAAYRAQGARVFVMDISRSMEAADLSPTRIARAKLKLLDLLKQARGTHTALIAYAEHPYVVTPLTHDARTVASLVPALATDIVPIQGSRPDRALVKAAALIRQSGLASGDIVLITDSAGDAMQTRDTARRLAQQHFRISVLAVGTPDGAPIPASNGQHLNDAQGRKVLATLDSATLRDIATLGGGAFTLLTPDDSDISALLQITAKGSATGAEMDKQNVGQWQDQGIYLVLALLPLAALGLRRGWLASFALLLVMQPNDAYALQWDELWSRPDQRGVSKLEAGRIDEALEHFQNPLWRGVAHYRAQRYDRAVDEFAKLDTATAHYNRGNALTQLHRLTEALAAYDAALALEPEHTDAQFNRDLVARQLAQPPSPSAANPAANASSPQPTQKTDAGSRRDATSSPHGTGDDGERTSAAQQATAADNGSSGTDTRDTRIQPHNSATESRSNSSSPTSEATAQHATKDATANPTQATQSQTDATASLTTTGQETDQIREAREAREQWLRRIPDDPAGLLRRKFYRDQQREKTEPSAASSDTPSAPTPW